jgi:putative tryptophan/tyrosine transport system substrate-binding protein
MILVLADTQVLEPNRAQVVAMAAKQRLPAVYPWHYYTQIGGLMSYGTSIPGLHYRSATYVDKILKGAKPADLRVEQPTKFTLTLTRTYLENRVKLRCRLPLLRDACVGPRDS